MGAVENFKFTLVELDDLCKGDKLTLAQRLTDWGLIPAAGTYKCPACGGNLKWAVDNERTDGLRWRCGASVQQGHEKRRRCPVRLELRHGTFFEWSILPLFQILGFVSCWVYQVPLSFISQQVRMSQQSAVDWASFCRELLLNAYIDQNEKLGGIGMTVEIDESKFAKRKYHRGHHVEGHWVFGGYERGTGRVFMVTAPDRSSETLLPVIQEWIKPGTTIISDYWRSYDCLTLHGYEHLKANHSLHFKDPDTGAHTNEIDSSWRAAKSTMSSSGRRRAHIPGNLARYMFQKRCNELKLDPMREFLRLAGLLYNPLTPNENQRDEDFTDESDVDWDG